MQEISIYKLGSRNFLKSGCLSKRSKKEKGSQIYFTEKPDFEIIKKNYVNIKIGYVDIKLELQDKEGNQYVAYRKFIKNGRTYIAGWSDYKEDLVK